MFHHQNYFMGILLKHFTKMQTKPLCVINNASGIFTITLKIKLILSIQNSVKFVLFFSTVLVECAKICLIPFLSS